MIIYWLEDAIRDLQHLRHYIAQDNKNAAKKIVKKIMHSTELLIEQPGMGRPGRVLNTRELVISDTPYIVPYRVKNEVIEILRVFHSSMRWPEHI